MLFAEAKQTVYHYSHTSLLLMLLVTAEIGMNRTLE